MNRAGVREAGRRLAHAWPYLVVVAVALLGSALHVARYTQLSPFDESRHVDYMVRIYEDGDFVRLGDKLGERAMRLEACRGVDVADYLPPSCDAEGYDPRDFRDDGFNNAVNNPPLYYLVTGAVTYAVEGVGLSDNVLDPARVMSGVWLAAGLALAVYAGVLLRVRRVPLVAGAVILALAPEVLFMGATVNADSASVFGGALVLVAALWWERGRIGPAWMAGAGAAVAALKMTNLIGVGVVAAWLLGRAWWARRVAVLARDDVGAGAQEDLGRTDADVAEPALRSPAQYLWAAGLLVGGAFGMTVLWLLVAGARATVDALALPSNQQFYERGFPWRALVQRQNVFSLFPPLGNMRPPILDTLMNQTVAHAATWLAGAVLIAAALRAEVRDRVATLGAWAAAVLLAAGPAFIVSTWVVNNVIFQPVPRYGLSAIAMLVVVIGAAARGRVGTIVLLAVAALSVGTVLGTLVFG